MHLLQNLLLELGLDVFLCDEDLAWWRQALVFSALGGNPGLQVSLRLRQRLLREADTDCQSATLARVETQIDALAQEAFTHETRLRRHNLWCAMLVVDRCLRQLDGEASARINELLQSSVLVGLLVHVADVHL